MNILIEIGHPAHVHFFKELILRLESQGENIKIVTRDKEITNQLLRDFGFSFKTLSSEKSSLFGKLFELAYRWVRISKIIVSEKIDVLISISGISTAMPGWILRRKVITFTDTEDADLSNALAMPFSTCIATPKFFLKDFGRKHIRYSGLHEVAYLKAFQFASVADDLKDMNLTSDYVILRLISYQALHDRSLVRPKEELLLEFISNLEKFGRVLISSEAALPESLKGYALDIPITKIHSVLAGAVFFVGESPTMAVEASVLGTPSILISERAKRLGNMLGLEKEGLLINKSNLTEAQEYLSTVDIKYLRQEWKVRATRFRRNCVDLSEVSIKLIRDNDLDDGSAKI